MKTYPSKIVAAILSSSVFLISCGASSVLEKGPNSSNTQAYQGNSSTVSADNAQPISSDLSRCENLLVNGNFDNGLTGWKANDFYGAKTDVLTESRNTFVRMAHDSEKSWSSIGQEVASRLQVGKTYVVRLKYRVESDQSIGIRFGDSSTMQHSSAINEKYGWNRLITGAKDWREDVFEFVATEIHPKSDEPMFAIYFDYSNIGEIFVDDVMIAEKKISCQSASSNTFSGNQNSSSDMTSRSSSQGSETLTTERAQRAVDKGMESIKKHLGSLITPNARAVVRGVREMPQFNIAQADITFVDTEVGCNTGLQIQKFKWNNGVAIFNHYTDGRWVLTEIEHRVLWLCDPSYKFAGIEVK